VDFAQRAIDLIRENVAAGGLPFATVIVKDGEIIAECANRVPETHDPTAHGEILAIREACTKLGIERLDGCTVYIGSHPCPMCLGALYHAAPDEVIFLASREAYAPYYTDAKPRYFEPSEFYGEFGKPWQERRLPMRYEPRDNIVEVYKLWHDINVGTPDSSPEVK
jgi:tRNA(Arg) A34 adenosine deaminase TadA